MITCENITVDNFGIIDMVLKSVTGTCKFKPANLTEAQIDTLIGCKARVHGCPGRPSAMAEAA